MLTVLKYPPAVIIGETSFNLKYVLIPVDPAIPLVTHSLPALNVYKKTLQKVFSPAAMFVKGKNKPP